MPQTPSTLQNTHTETTHFSSLPLAQISFKLNISFQKRATGRALQPALAEDKHKQDNKDWVAGRTETAGRRHKRSNYFHRCTISDLSSWRERFSAPKRGRFSVSAGTGVPQPPRAERSPALSALLRTPRWPPWPGSLCVNPSYAASWGGKATLTVHPNSCLLANFLFQKHLSLRVQFTSRHRKGCELRPSQQHWLAVLLRTGWFAAGHGLTPVGNTCPWAKSTTGNCLCSPRADFLQHSVGQRYLRHSTAPRGNAGTRWPPRDCPAARGQDVTERFVGSLTFSPEIFLAVLQCTSRSSLLGLYLSSSQEFPNSFPKVFWRLTRTKCLRVFGWERAVEEYRIIEAFSSQFIVWFLQIKPPQLCSQPPLSER